jgi:DNA-binding transcriptional LysR family regulator
MSCPIAIAQNLLAPILPEFMQRYPDVELQLDVSNRRVDLIEEGVDIALRVRSAALEDSSLVARAFGSASSALVAAPALLARRVVPQSPDELADWPSLGMAPHDGRHVWVFAAEDGARLSVNYAPRLITDDLVVLHEAALAGIGVACLPAMICADSLKQGLLVELLPQWRAPTAVFHAVFPSRRGMMPAVRALLDFLAEKLSDGA